MAQKMTKNKKILKGIIVCSLCVNVIGGTALCTYADTISKQPNITVIKSQKNNDLKIKACGFMNFNIFLKMGNNKSSLVIQ